jgi:hypothetical protein
VWADTLLQAERQHVLQLLVWAASSVLGGAAIGGLITIRRIRSPLLVHFAIQTALWGIGIGAVAARNWHELHLRDYTEAAFLIHVLWMLVAGGAGLIVAGCVIAVCAWIVGRRLAGVGAGVAIAVQGVALLVLNLQFATIVSR